MESATTIARVSRTSQEEITRLQFRVLVRSRSVGSQGCAVRCRSMSHDGHCTAGTITNGPWRATSTDHRMWKHESTHPRFTVVGSLWRVRWLRGSHPRRPHWMRPERLSAKKESATVQSGNPLCPFLPLDHFRTPASSERTLLTKA